jgi:two-component system chemotaxis response regulator CheB
VVSSLTPENSEMAIRALSLGAGDVIAKPGSALSVPDVADRLAHAIRAAAGARVEPRTAPAPDAPRVAACVGLKTTYKILAIGASTGGTRAIEVVLRSLPAEVPGTLIVQHMPAHFTESLAKRLDSVCAMEVREARDNDTVLPGVALIAPGGFHMELRRSGARYYVATTEAPPEHFQRPAVDVLFRSVAKEAGRNAIGVLLTGMGADGATGMLAMKQAGSHTIAEDEKTCVVFGMPREAIRLGAADDILPLDKVADGIMGSRILREERAVTAPVL